MESRKWKKIAIVFGVIFLLVFTFWYGGGAKGLHGFRVSDEVATSQMETVENTDQMETKSKATEEKEVANQETITEETKKQEKNVFEKFFMNIKLKSSAKKKNTKKNAQYAKNAQSNANKAASKAKKSKKTKKKSNKNVASNNSNQKEKQQTTDISNNENKESEQTTHTDNQTNSDITSNQKDSTNETNDPSSNQEQTENTTSVNDQNETTNQEQDSEDGTVACTIYISCATLLDNMDTLSKAKQKQVPKDGVILKETTVKIKEGSSVFDVLCKVTKKNDIQLEYSFTPAYKSYYIEGIHNLYEFDGGQLSGWMYSVNGEFPGYGCSAYTVKDGDEIKWLYTCNLGKDVGGYFEE